MIQLFRDISIRRKLTIIILMTSGVALLMASAAFVLYDRSTFRESMVEDLRTWAQILEDQGTVALDYQDAANAEGVLSTLHVKDSVVSAYFFEGEEIFAEYHRPGRTRAEPDRELLKKDDVHVFTPDRLHYVRHVMEDGQHVASIYLESDLSALQARVSRFAGIVMVVLLGALLVALVMSSVLQRIISGPIVSLADVMRRVTQKKDFSIRAERVSGDETGALIDGFNDMLSQIQRRDEALGAARDQLEQRVVERTGELQRQLERISLLNHITRAIADREDLESILNVTMLQLQDHLRLDMVLVFLHRADRQGLEVAASRSRRLAPAGGEAFAKGAALELEGSGLELCPYGETIYCSDTAHSAGRVMAQLRELELHSVLSVPLMVENGFFGLMLVAREKANAFSSRESEFMRMLSEQVALAAHQAQLNAKLKTAYEELRQTQQTAMQQERLRALGQMASGIAHDINNALSPIVGYSGLLLQQFQNLPKDARDYIKFIHTSGEDIAHIVSRMREFYRTRDEKEQLQPVKLNDMVEQVAVLTRPRWRDIPQEMGCVVEMRKNLAPDLPLVNGIESELREALTNLILNAVDAMPDGGTLTVRTAPYGLGPNRRPGASQVMVEVQDSGLGMDEETSKRCLEPFFSTKGQRGTGLGLAMVYGVIQRHGGKIEVQSKMGRGTTVRLIMPASEEGTARAPARNVSLSSSDWRILCIDDEPLMSKLLTEIFKSQGCAVTACAGGADGIQEYQAAQVEGRPYDLVITDLGMPRVDGRQVAAVIKRESPQTPVVMLTGWGMMMDWEAGPLQADAVLSKPPKIQELFQTVNNLLQDSSEPPLRSTGAAA